MAKHLCHHPRCNTPVPEALFACKPHWFSLPKQMRDRIWAEYVPGQEVTKTPTGSYLNAATDAIDWWNHKDGVT